MTFQDLYDKLLSGLKDEGEINTITSRFMKCKCDSERVNFVFEVSNFHKLFKCQGLRSGKSGDNALQRKEAGNSSYKNKDFSNALKFYTQGIFAAPSFSSVLPVLYANRSAVLFHLRQYSLCIRDIELAISKGYPTTSTFKLYERKGKCYQLLRKTDKAKIAFNDSLHSLAQSSFSKEERNEKAREVLKQIQKCKSNDSSQEITPNGEIYHRQPVLPVIAATEGHPVFKSASKVFSLCYDETRGRFGVASEDIYPGDVVIIDKPFAKTLLPELHLSHCFYCLTRCQALLSCRQCSTVGFCSENCEERAWKEYHYAECLYLEELLLSNIGLGYLAQRVVLSAGYDQLMSLKNLGPLTQSVPEMQGLNKEGLYHPLSYYSIHSLMGNTDKRSVADLFQRSVKAAFLLKLLQFTPFFPTDVPEENLHFVGGILLKQLQMLPCNAHEVSELIYPGSFASAESREIGSAIYATLSLLNHSCDPSVVRHCYGADCVLRAIKKIKKGEEIVDNYGTVYPVSNRIERSQLLEGQYYFKCQCRACTDDWPLYDSIPSGDPVFRCPICKLSVSVVEENNLKFISCCKCQHKEDYTKQLENFQKSRSMFLEGKSNVLEGGQVSTQFPVFLKHLNLISDLVCLPWQEFNDCQEIVKQCFSMLANCHFVGK